MRLGVGSAVVVTRGRNGCVRGMERDAGGRGQARVGEAFAEQSAGRGTRWWCARPRQGGNGRGLLSRRAVTLVGLPGVGSALGRGRGSARRGRWLLVLVWMPLGTQKSYLDFLAATTGHLACTGVSGNPDGNQRVPSTLRFRKFPGKPEGVWCSILFLSSFPRETREFP